MAAATNNGVSVQLGAGGVSRPLDRGEPRAERNVRAGQIHLVARGKVAHEIVVRGERRAPAIFANSWVSEPVDPILQLGLIHRHHLLQYGLVFSFQMARRQVGEPLRAQRTHERPGRELRVDRRPQSARQVHRRGQLHAAVALARPAGKPATRHGRQVGRERQTWDEPSIDLGALVEQRVGAHVSEQYQHLQFGLLGRRQSAPHGTVLGDVLRACVA